LYVARAEPMRDGGGAITAWFGTSTDIHDRCEVEERLRESEAKFQAIANSIEQMVWSMRPNGYHDFYNQRWYDYTGVPEGSTDGEAWNGMFHPDGQERTWTT
jgi:PAS domain-containing protein